MLSKIHNLQDKSFVKRIGEMAFYLAVLLEIIIVIVDKSNIINAFEGRMFQITFLLCFIKVLTTKYNYKEYGTIFVFCFLGLLIDQFGDRNEILRSFMFVVACKDVDIRKVLKGVFWGTLAGSILIILLSLLGILGTVQVAKIYSDGTVENNFCFGMGNANTFHIMMFAIALLGMFLYAERLRWWFYCVLFVADILLFILCDAKTPSIMMALSIFGMAFIRLVKRDIILQIISILQMVGMLFWVILSVYFAASAYKIYEFKWSRLEGTREIEFLIKLDNMLTGRISMLMEYNDRAGSIKSWKWFAVPNHERYFDLGYVRLFYWYGIVPAVIILLILLSLVIFLLKQKKYQEIMFISMISIFTLVEAHFVSVYIGRCYPLFILGMYWCQMICLPKIKKN